MPFPSASFNVILAAVISGTVLMGYLRYRNGLDSNIPLVYYGIMVVYTSTLEESPAPWIIYSGLALALLLRFEFMNQAFIRVVLFFEYLVFALIVCEGTAVLLRR